MYVKSQPMQVCIWLGFQGLVVWNPWMIIRQHSYPQSPLRSHCHLHLVFYPSFSTPESNTSHVTQGNLWSQERAMKGRRGAFHHFYGGKSPWSKDQVCSYCLPFRSRVDEEKQRPTTWLEGNTEWILIRLDDKQRIPSLRTLFCKTNASYLENAVQ